MCSYTFSHSPFLPNDQGPESVILHIINPDEKNEILRKLNCPKPADIIGIVIGIIGAIVGVGKYIVFCLGNCSESQWKLFSVILFLAVGKTFQVMSVSSQIFLSVRA